LSTRGKKDPPIKARVEEEIGPKLWEFGVVVSGSNVEKKPQGSMKVKKINLIYMRTGGVSIIFLRHG